MKHDNEIARCIQRALESYFKDLDGEKPCAIYDMVMASVERPLIAFALEREKTLRDIEAAINFARDYGKIGLVGYCWGGTMAYAAACSFASLSAVSAYYGGGVTAMKEHEPKGPTIVHFGERDAHIPMDGVRAFQSARQDVAVYVYAAEHGFNCDQRASFDEASAALARARTLEHFAKYLG